MGQVSPVMSSGKEGEEFCLVVDFAQECLLCPLGEVIRVVAVVFPPLPRVFTSQQVGKQREEGAGGGSLGGDPRVFRSAQ